MLIEANSETLVTLKSIVAIRDYKNYFLLLFQNDIQVFAIFPYEQCKNKQSK